MPHDVLTAMKKLPMRQNITATRGIQIRRDKPLTKYRNGFKILPADKRIITPELVQKLLERESP